MPWLINLFNIALKIMCILTTIDQGHSQELHYILEFKVK